VDLFCGLNDNFTGKKTGLENQKMVWSELPNIRNLNMSSKIIYDICEGIGKTKHLATPLSTDGGRGVAMWGMLPNTSAL
jgi:hypothetical protein